MNPDDAQEQLRLVAQAQKAEKEVGQPEVGWLWLIWGMVWLIGFLLSQFAPSTWLLWSWLALCTAGGIGSGVFGVRLGQQVQYVQTGPKLGWFYGVSLGFCLLWLFLAQPESWEQTAILAVSFLAFTIIVSGILLKARLLILVGVGGIIFVTAVYLLLPAQLGLLLGIVGGGSMIAFGLWLLLSGGRRDTA